jgi:hypothetical protein
MPPADHGSAALRYRALSVDFDPCHQQAESADKVRAGPKALRKRRSTAILIMGASSARLMRANSL